jgi:hypothetical protein
VLKEYILQSHVDNTIANVEASEIELKFKSKLKKTKKSLIKSANCPVLGTKATFQI